MPDPLCREIRIMRRILALVVLVALLASTGCMSTEKPKWLTDALGDLNGNNTKNIAPLSGGQSSSAFR
jgi:hypothetical protein